MVGRLIGIVSMTLCATTVHGQVAIQKCVGADGKIQYQDSPCDAKQKAAGTLQRDRTQPDPAALQRAKSDQERVTAAAAERVKKEKAEQAAYEKRLEADAKAKADAELKAAIDASTRAGGTVAQDPRYYVLPLERPTQPIVIRETPPAPKLLDPPRNPTAGGIGSRK